MEKSVETNSALVINEVQMILAEKRTALSAMRTGIAVFALPLSVLSILVATSRYYDVLQVMHLLVPFLRCALLWSGSAPISSSTQSAGFIITTGSSANSKRNTAPSPSFWTEDRWTRLILDH